MCFRRVVPLLLAVSLSLGAADPWYVARARHFEVYSHRSAAEARATLTWFEQLRSIATKCFGLSLFDNRLVSVFGFSSEAEYDPFRLGATSDAYYVGADGRDYIVMPTMGSDSLGIAAHEFAHVLIHAAGARVPPWLSEGLADVFSTVRITSRRVQLGGVPAGRLSTLRTRAWLPLETLLSLPADSPVRNTRAGSDIFYAESWALSEMLLLSPQYGPRFRSFVSAASHTAQPYAEILEQTYARPLSDIRKDLELWVRRHKSTYIVLDTAPLPSALPIENIETSNLNVQLTLAGILLAAENLEGAESIYRDVASESPSEPAVLAGLATVALGRGQSDRSQALFARALATGLADANLCYRYFVLLDRAGGPVEERRTALDRVISLRPDFDDARYALALLEKNSGNNQAALLQLRAMRYVAPARAYHYWVAMADALIGIGNAEGAVAAARKAAGFASGPEEHSRAERLAQTAQTHLGVRFTVDASGRQRLVTTRVSNDETEWNPFIEPTDDIRRVEGTLREVDCTGPVTRMVIDTGSGSVRVAIPDPTHVQMHNAPAEFVCGQQSPASVVVRYAADQKLANADGVARGIDFR